MWQIKNGHIIISNVIIGRDKKALAGENTPLPIPHLLEGTKTFDMHYPEKISIRDDWLFLLDKQLAYHRDGFTAYFLNPIGDADEVVKLLENVDTKWGHAFITPSTTYYYYYVDDKLHVHPPGAGYDKEHATVLTQEPEKAYKLIKDFKKFTGHLPEKANENIARRGEVEFDGEVFTLGKWSGVYIHKNDVEGGEIDFTTGRKMITIKKGSKNLPAYLQKIAEKIHDDIEVDLRIINGIIDIAFIRKPGIWSTTIDRRGLKRSKFLKIIEKIVQTSTKPGAAPYRWDSSPHDYTATTIVEDTIVKFNIKYGWTIDGLKFVYSKRDAHYIPTKPPADRVVVRVFPHNGALCRRDRTYYLNNKEIGEFNSPYDALMHLDFSPVEKKMGAYKEVPVIKVQIGDDYIEKFEYTKENKQKIEKIVNMMKDLFSLTPFGNGYVERIYITRKPAELEKMRRELELEYPGLTWVLQNGSIIIVPLTGFTTVKPNVSAKPEAIFKEDVFEELVVKEGAQKISFSTIEEYII